MRLITERAEVLRRLRRAGHEQIPLLCPNAETPEEMEGILLGAERHAARLRGRRVVVGLGITATYPGHPQLLGLAQTTAADLTEVRRTVRRWLHWLHGYVERLAGCAQVEVIPFLDHGWAAHDVDVRLMSERWFQDSFGIVMFDASSLEWAENIRRTRAYVKAVRGRVVVEGCADAISSWSARGVRARVSGADWSDPAQVERYVRATGVDLIVPNLGTEHRMTSGAPVVYRRELAREIARRLGPMQSLHGTSSLGGRLGTVGGDGICKVNLYTALARDATSALRSAWSAAAPGEVLPLRQSCGSFIFRTRRDAIAGSFEVLLARLARTEKPNAAAI
jgi:fructose/tagatose bisphosphate aldolase